MDDSEISLQDMTQRADYSGMITIGNSGRNGFSQDTFELLFRVMTSMGLRLTITKVNNGRADLVAFTPRNGGAMNSGKRSNKYTRTVLASGLTESEINVVLGVLSKLEVIDEQKDPERSWQGVEVEGY